MRLIVDISQATWRNARGEPDGRENDVGASALESAQLPPEFLTLITYLFREVLDGRNVWVADGVTRAMGRAPRDFTEYARDTAATGVWNVGREVPADVAHTA
jgi:hypothetical protein